MKENQTVTDIKKILERFNDKSFVTSLDMDAISRLQVSLAVHNARLGEMVANAEKVSKEATANYEFKREQIYYNHRQAGKTGADSDNLKRIEAESDRQFAIVREYEFKILANLRKDVMNLIEAVRSRLSLLKDERRQISGEVTHKMAIKNLSMSIIERFMDDQQVQDFLVKYNASRKNIGVGTNRFDFLSIIPTEKEIDMMGDYLKDDKRTMKELAEFYGLEVNKYRDTVYNTAIRIAYQKSKQEMVREN